MQKEVHSTTVTIVILTHKAVEKKLNAAIAESEALDDGSVSVMRIRVEAFDNESY